MTQISRRSLFGAAAAASVLPVAGGLAAFSPIAAAAAAPKKARTIVEIAAMSPVDMARESDVVQTSYEIIRAAAGRLRDPELRKAVLSIIENPAPTIASADQSAVLAALKKEGLIAAGRTSVFPKFSDTTRSPQPTWSAPGSGYGSHHAYPGGLCTHVALNVVSAESLVAAYNNIDGLKLDFDHAVGGEILHDLHKPWSSSGRLTMPAARRRPSQARANTTYSASPSPSSAACPPNSSLPRPAPTSIRAAPPAKPRSSAGSAPPRSSRASTPSRPASSPPTARPCRCRAASRAGSYTSPTTTGSSPCPPASGSSRPFETSLRRSGACAMKRPSTRCATTCSATRPPCASTASCRHRARTPSPPTSPAKSRPDPHKTPERPCVSHKSTYEKAAPDEKSPVRLSSHLDEND
ncbi:MAG: hypothetical protein ACLUHG_00655 [Sutterella wadsworthensis]